MSSEPNVPVSQELIRSETDTAPNDPSAPDVPVNSELSDDETDSDSADVYDHNVLVTYATRMHFWGNVWAVLIGIACAIAGAIFGNTIGEGGGQAIFLGLIIGSALGALGGYVHYFNQRLLSQLVLCQVQIESNTRPNRESTPATSQSNQ